MSKDLRTKSESKNWTKPQLTILLKGASDERVLETCKGGGTFGPGNDAGWCGNPPLATCNPCSEKRTS